MTAPDANRMSSAGDHPVATALPAGTAVVPEHVDALDILEGTMVLHRAPDLTVDLLLNNLALDDAIGWAVAVVDLLVEYVRDGERRMAAVEVAVPPRIAGRLAERVPVLALERTVDLDAEIAPLVQFLWSRDRVTYFCCQGGDHSYDGLSYIDMADDGLNTLFGLASDAGVDHSLWSLSIVTLYDETVDAIRVRFSPGDLLAMVRTIELRSDS